MSLKTKFLSLFAIFIVVNLISGLFVISVISGQKGDAVIVNLAGKQRMLNQKMTKEALAVSRGLEKEEALKKTADMFDRTLKGLIAGDEKLGLPPTEDEGILKQLGVVQTLWKEFSSQINIVLRGSLRLNKAYRYIRDENIPLLKEMNRAVVMMEEANAPSKQVNIAGRQRMLIQKISKESILFSQGMIGKHVLDSTVSLFNTSLSHLLSKDTQDHLAVQNQRIREQLESVRSHWFQFSENVDILSESSSEVGKALTYLRENNITLLKEMNKAVHLYEQHSRAKVDRLQMIQVLSVSLVIVIVILGWLFFVRPLVNLLTRVITELEEGALQVRAASNEISSSSQDLAESASTEASSIEETSSSLEQISEMTNKNASSVADVNNLATNAKRRAEGAENAMKNMLASVQDINESSSRISNIIKVIDDIAFQTNLLALNAAVEAARAGEMGKGFAVVAEEVRNLAQRSAQAAKETASLIEESVKKAEQGGEIAQDAERMSKEVTEEINKVSTIIEDISVATSEQSEGVHQISLAVNQLDGLTQRIAANAEEEAASSEELSAQSEQMSEMVAQLGEFVHGVKGHSTSSGMQQPKKNAPRQLKAGA